jgi:hypothetical protein
MEFESPIIVSLLGAAVCGVRDAAHGAKNPFKINKLFFHFTNFG